MKKLMVSVSWVVFFRACLDPMSASVNSACKMSVQLDTASPMVLVLIELSSLMATTTAAPAGPGFPREQPSQKSIRSVGFILLICLLMCLLAFAFCISVLLFELPKSKSVLYELTELLNKGSSIVIGGSGSSAIVL